MKRSFAGKTAAITGGPHARPLTRVGTQGNHGQRRLAHGRRNAPGQGRMGRREGGEGEGTGRNVLIDGGFTSV